MADEAHEWTDGRIDALAKELHQLYAECVQRVQGFIRRELRGWDRKIADWRRRVESGEATEEEFREWRRSQAANITQWQDMADALARDMTRTDDLALQIARGELPGVFAENCNFAAFQFERKTCLPTMFTLYDESTVRLLAEKQPDLLPSLTLDPEVDLEWNRRHVTSAVQAAVLTGEPLGRTAERVSSVCGMDYRAAMRASRTAMTAAQNMGRLEGMRQCASMTGIHVKKQWMATLDGRTRHSHRKADGESVEMNSAFEATRCRFPGDPEGPAEEVMNCRCTLVVDIDMPELEGAVTNRHSRLGEMSYEKWKKQEKGAARGR